MLHLIQKEGQPAVGPLDSIELLIEPPDRARLSVTDGAGDEYFNSKASERISFLVGGVVGLHRIRLLDAGNRVLAERSFHVAAQTKITDEKEEFSDLLQALHRTMLCYSPTGSSEIKWKGGTYPCFVPWILDHVHTARGMQYFSADARGWLISWSKFSVKTA